MILAELQSVGLAGLTMVVLGGSFAVILLIASIKLKVAIDPKVEQVHEALPNIDCGACGFAGCGQYAKAVAEDPELLGKCLCHVIFRDQFLFYEHLAKAFILCLTLFNGLDQGFLVYKFAFVEY